MDPVTPELLAAMVVIPARAVARRFRGHVEMEDVVQEGHLYVLAQLDAEEEQQDREERGLKRRDKTPLIVAIEEGNSDVCDQQIYRHCERFARREKAARTGYQTADEQFYSDDSGGTAILADLLQYVLADTWPDSPPGLEEREHVSGSRPISEGGNWTAMLCDISAAYGRLRHEDRLLLHRRFRGQYTVEQIGVMMDMAHQRVSEELRRALRRLLNQLGGVSPWR